MAMDMWTVCNPEDLEHPAETSFQGARRFCLWLSDPALGQFRLERDEPVQQRGDLWSVVDVVPQGHDPRLRVVRVNLRQEQFEEIEVAVQPARDGC